MTLFKILISYLICHNFCSTIIAKKNSQTCLSDNKEKYLSQVRHYASKTSYPINDYKLNSINYTIAGKGT